jgi:hypothetical protein
MAVDEAIYQWVCAQPVSTLAQELLQLRTPRSGDLMIAKGGKSAVTTLVERTSLRVVLVLLSGRDELTVGDAVIAATGILPRQIAKSLTLPSRCCGWCRSGKRREDPAASHRASSPGRPGGVTVSHLHSETPWERRWATSPWVFWRVCRRRTVGGYLLVPVMSPTRASVGCVTTRWYAGVLLPPRAG